MRFLPTLSLVASASALAAVAPRGGQYTDRTTCYTSLTTSRCSYKTTWSTTYTPCTSSATSTKITTVTPTTQSQTTTVTVTSTSTAPTSILTSTVTSVGGTLLSTVTTTSTVVASTTVTSTQTVSSTVGIPQGAAFTPVLSSESGSSYSGSGGSAPQKRDSNDTVSDLSERSSRSGYNPRDHKYPKGVSCQVWTHQSKCSSITSTLTSTVTASTPSTTLTSTSTITSTIMPSATTTTTALTTVTSTVTSTATTTSTQTQTQVQTTTSTVYAACPSSNFADAKNGLPFDGTFDTTNNNGFNNFMNVDGPTNAAQCCQTAAQYTNPFDFFIWDNGVGGNTPTCYLSYESGTCAAGQSTQSYTAETYAGGTTFEFTIGNGYCGEFTA